MLEAIYASSNYQASKLLLDVSAKRHQVLAGNLANVDTAAYRRLDIDPAFRVQLEEMVKTGNIEGMKRLQVPEILPEADLGAVHPNGNNVSMDRELMEINQNALEYQAMTQFVSSSLSRLKMAITGRVQ